MSNNKIYSLVFDQVIVKQLKKEASNNDIKNILIKMLDKLEEKGPIAGKLLDSKLFIYELKNKRPPIRLYFKHINKSNELYIFEFEMKRSDKKQKITIERIRSKAENLKS